MPTPVALAITILQLGLVFVGLYGGSLGAILASRKGSLGSGLIGAGILLLVAHTLLDFGGSGMMDLITESMLFIAVSAFTIAIHRLWAGDEPVADADRIPAKHVEADEETATPHSDP